MCTCMPEGHSDTDARAEDWTPYDGPCPYCGSTAFGDTSRVHGKVDTAEDGGIANYERDQVGSTLTAQCLGCDRVLYDEDGGDD